MSLAHQKGHIFIISPCRYALKYRIISNFEWKIKSFSLYNFIIPVVLIDKANADIFFS